MENNIIEMRVGRSSGVQALSTAIASAILKDVSKVVKLRAVGAAAVNQMVKACAQARGRVAQAGWDLKARPGFESVDIDGKDSTAIVLLVSIN